MNHSQLARGGKVSEPPLPPASNNNNDHALLQSMRHLSVNTASATALSPSPRISSPHRSSSARNASIPSERRTQSPLRRSPSAMSLDTRTASPTLLRKASMNSLKNAGAVTPPRSSSRRSSSAHGANHVNSVFGRSRLSNLEDEAEEHPAITAESIANAHFAKELDLHHLGEDERPADTIVILHDACYGHRYSRPRTTRAGLSTIVERPERIHASILGVCAAYVRLGERHAEGRNAIRPKHHPANTSSIPFRIRKTSRKLDLSSPAVTNVHGTKWMEELKIMCEAAEAKLAMNGKELARPQMNRGQETQSPQQFHEGDLYLCSESLNAMEGALGAVCEGVDSVFNATASGNGPRRAFVVVRPPGHHCSASYPSGFCWVNNVHVGIAHAALNHGLTHAAIIDFDLHHGDGSQSIAWEHNSRSTSLPKNASAWKKTSIGYFSLHDINSYPCEMGDEEKVKNASICIDNAHGQNIWNVHLQPWKTEAEFWQLYETKYMVLLEKARLFLRGQTDRIRDSQSALQPKAAIFLSAGFDASEWESPGMQRHKVNVPTEFYARLTRDVKRIAGEEGCSVDGRIISVLEGGYSNRALSSGVLSHLCGLAGSDPDMVEKHIEPSGLGYEIAQRAGSLSLNSESLDSHALPAYDSSWWALPQLDLLDLTVNPPAPPEAKKPRDNNTPAYFSTTQSFNAKVVESPKSRRSSSAIHGGSPRAPAKSVSPPPPEVGWATAAHELSKLLIPTDRQTMSCKPEELSAEATRARRDRQSIITPPASAATTPDTTPSTRMSLRERKVAKPVDKAVGEPKAATAARAGRRQTVAGAAVLATDKVLARNSSTKPEFGHKQPTEQSSRRLSLTSNAGSVATVATSVMTSNGRKLPSHPPVPSRPDSSQSIRPDSSMSSRGPSFPPILVRKTRAPTAARGEAPKPSRASARAPAARKASAPAGNKDDIPLLRRQPSKDQSMNGLVAPTATATVGSLDIDSLTSGMKKVKISLTTKAQRDARAAAATASAKAPAPRKPSTESTTTSTVPQSVQGVPEQPPVMKPATPTKQQQVAKPFMGELPPPTPEPLTPHPSIAARLQQLQAASTVPLPMSSPPRPATLSSMSSLPTSTSTSPTSHPAAQRSNVFIAYQPEGPTPRPGPQEDKLKWLEPNTETPAISPLKKSDLPVFSSTGFIPFGVKSEESADGKEKREVDIWEVPETPGKM